MNAIAEPRQTTTAERAFNRPHFEQVNLSPRQVEQLLSTACVFTGSKGFPTASWFWTFYEGAIPTKLEVFRVSMKGGEDLYERRIGVALPPFLAEIIEP